MNAIDRLAALLAKLPGIGKKSALRLAYHILDADAAFAKTLADALASLHGAIRRCPVCGAWTDSDEDTPLCAICADEKRDKTVLCVVERPQDIAAIEDAREFAGRFHVLGGLIAPLDGVTPDKLAIAPLVERVRRDAVREVILALNPTVEGDTTALFLQKQLAAASPAIAVTRLASGLPAGGDLEYADRLTLSRSFRGRVRM